MLGWSCSVAGVIAANAWRLFVHPIKPRAFAEECIDLSAGDTLSYRFASDLRVDFNIHHHEGAAVKNIVDAKLVTAHEGDFRAPVDNAYCLMWTAPDATPARVEGAWRRQPAT